MSKVKKLVRKHSKFNALADKAAANCWRSLQIWQKQNMSMSDKEVLERIAQRNRNLDGYGRGYAEPTFRKPTACKSGFFKVLLAINNYPGERSKALANWAGVKSLAMTLRRLEGAKLIERELENGIIEWYITKFGKKYLEAVFSEFNIKDNLF